jgi:hypothetical protein
MVKDGNLIAEEIRLFHIMGSQEYGPFAFEGEKVIPDHSFGLGVKSRSGFVQEKNPGIMDQGPGHDQPPLHSGGEFIGEIFLPCGEPHEVKKFVNAPLVRGRMHPVHFGVEDEIFPRREVAIQVVLLRDDSDQATDPGCLADHVVASYKSQPRGWVEQGGENIYQSSFTGSVGAEEAKNYTLGNCEGNLLYGHQTSVNFSNLSELNFVFHHHDRTFLKPDLKNPFPRTFQDPMQRIVRNG